MTRNKVYFGAASALAVAMSLAAADSAFAQAASATLRGTVYEGAAVETGGNVLATEIATGYVTRTGNKVSSELGDLVGLGGDSVALSNCGAIEITKASPP